MKQWLDSILKRPTRIIEGILVAIICAFAGGSVIHDIILEEYNQPLGVRITLTAIYLLLAAPTICSYIVNSTKWKYRLRLNGILLLLVAYGFLVLLRITTIGWYPLIWIYPLGGIAIVIICYICAVGENNNNGS